MVDENDREIWVGKNRIFIDEDDVIHFIAIGDHNEKEAIEINEAILKLGNMAEGKGKVLIDLNKAGKQSPEARKVGKEHSEHEKTGKIAMFGLHPVARVISSFVIGVTKKKDLRFFKTKEEALAWLKE